MGAFQDVRAAFCTNTVDSLRRVGVEKKGASSNPAWIPVKCPICPDTSGSASVAYSTGALVCHQCGYKNDLFRWIKESKKLNSDWEACQWLAKEFNVLIVTNHEKRGRPQNTFSPGFARDAMAALWSSPAAEGCRKFLEVRHLHEDPALAERLGIGYGSGKLLFFQPDRHGNLKDRYRTYNPATKAWGWSKGSDVAMGFWPGIAPVGTDGKIAKQQHIWILEGEWDVSTAWLRLHLQDQGIYCYTWVGGAGSPVRPELIPTWMYSQYVHICYDNDTFQGPDIATHWAPDDRKMAELRRRRENLLLGVGQAFKDAKDCQVWFHEIPIDPRDLWGADFRDWVDRGGRDPNTLKGHTFSDVVVGSKNVNVTTLPSAYEMAGEDVRFSCVVNTVEEDGISIPDTSIIDCERGQHEYCKKCKVLTIAPEGVLVWRYHPDDLVSAILSGDIEGYAIKKMLGKPSACTFCRIHTRDYRPGCVWSAVEAEASGPEQMKMVAISKDAPALSDELQVTGRVHHYKNTIAIKVNRLDVMDRTDINFDPYKIDLLDLCPWESNDAAKIDEYLTKRSISLADNVTRIYGREDIHVAAELVAHSPLWIHLDGHKRRGWLDACILGPTRTGKSMTVRHLMDYHGLGVMHTCLENISRAGLTMGATTGRNKQMTMKPGLLPRSNGKMLVLDEYHTMVSRLKYNPMADLMSARDSGTVGGIKVYGSTILPAAVRLITICNWVRGRAETFEFPCQHFLYLYGTPESLSRMDFGLVVPEQALDMVGSGSGSEHVWTRELMRVLILRAWGQKMDHVHFDEKAIQLAKDQCLLWEADYCDELPLFVTAEKHFSLLRMAAATANLCLAHPEKEFTHAEVRTGHVEWAAMFMERTWKQSRYDEYSKTTIARREVPKSFHVEATFLVGLNLDDADNAKNFLPHFLGSLEHIDINSFTGLHPTESAAWFSKMIRLNALERTRNENSHKTEWRLSPGCYQIAKNAIILADEYPWEYARRYEKIKNWNFGPKDVNPDLPSLGLSEKELRDVWGNSHPTTPVHFHSAG